MKDVAVPGGIVNDDREGLAASDEAVELAFRGDRSPRSDGSARATAPRTTSRNRWSTPSRVLMNASNRGPGSTPRIQLRKPGRAGRGARDAGVQVVRRLDAQLDASRSLLHGEDNVRVAETARGAEDRRLDGLSEVREIEREGMHPHGRPAACGAEPLERDLLGRPPNDGALRSIHVRGEDRGT